MYLTGDILDNLCAMERAAFVPTLQPHLSEAEMGQILTGETGLSVNELAIVITYEVDSTQAGPI